MYCKGSLPKDKYTALDALISDTKRGNLYTGNRKFAIIHDLVKAAVNAPAEKPALSKFDKIATSRIFGKPLAVGIMLLSFMAAMIFAAPFMMLGGMSPSLLSEPLHNLLSGIGAPDMVTSFISDLLPNIPSFALSMCGFVMGVTFAFSLIEEVGYMARMAFVFDSLMAKLGCYAYTCTDFLRKWCYIGTDWHPVTHVRIYGNYRQSIR